MMKKRNRAFETIGTVRPGVPSIIILGTLEEMDKEIKMQQQEQAQTIVQQANDLYGEVEGTAFWIYGSPMRPMSAVWAPIPDVRFVNADKAATGMHTWVVTPNALDQKTISSYELELVYAPVSLAPNGKPKVIVKLFGENGNADLIVIRCQKAMRKAGWGTTEIHDFGRQARSSDYDHLLQTVMAYVDEPAEEKEGDA